MPIYLSPPSSYNNRSYSSQLTRTPPIEQTQAAKKLSKIREDKANIMGMTAGGITGFLLGSSIGNTNSTKLISTLLLTPLLATLTGRGAKWWSQKNTKEEFANLSLGTWHHTQSGSKKPFGISLIPRFDPYIL